MAWEKIFEVGCEGGVISVLGRVGRDGQWTFLMTTDERTMLSMTDEFSADELYSEKMSDSWEGILQKLDEYPWTHLSPLGPFHEAFRDRIWTSFHEREVGGRYYPDKWAELCGRPVAGAGR